ncbi:MAG: hypothetical protein E6J01_17640 [Chloroflexi bacterium]|nr:MAG: hypothetical protein E6J01_17640 [Chloroflexota bacterium]
MSGPPRFARRRSVLRRWSVYVVRRRDGALYTGIATDVRHRIAEHAGKSGKGAKSLRGKGPLHLVLQRVIGSKGLALRVEGTIKKLPKARKEELIVREVMVDRLIRLVRVSLATPHRTCAIRSRRTRRRRRTFSKRSPGMPR